MMASFGTTEAYGIASMDKKGGNGFLSLMTNVLSSGALKAGLLSACAT
jgi:hypothetical protein